MPHSPVRTFSTLVELLRTRAEHLPQQVAYTWLQDGEVESGALTYADLDRQARAIAAMLQAHAKPGDRALLLYPPGLDFIAAFFGCLYAGVVAVPAYPPRNLRGLPRLQSIFADSRARLALSTENVLAPISAAPELAAVRLLATDRLPEGLEDSWQPPVLTSESLAFLQYTSGSTSAPKGVMVSHANIMANERAVEAGMGHSSETVFVGWLPVYHDMGLIGNVLQPMHLGIPCVLMSPLDFLKRPLRWLEAITRYRATTSGGPNFAYDLCARKVTPEQLAQLDLGSWHVAYNGAEPVRSETLARFSETFASAGFRPEAWYPCYGMAEATLFVTGGESSALPITRGFDASLLSEHQVVTRPAGEGTRDLVGCGRTWSDHEVRIVDPETLMPCQPERVGEIWVKGPSVAQGYWGRPDLSEATFHAYLSETGEGPYLRTGDLGFVHEGELFVTGRLKDLIIIRGRNHYPQDIELTAEQSHGSLRQGCSAAFTVEVAGEERLVLVAEAERRLRTNRLTEGNRTAMEERLDSFEPAPSELEQKEVIGAIRQAVSEHHELMVHDVVLVMATSIPKTSSGKIQRHACKRGYLEGTLKVLS